VPPAKALKPFSKAVWNPRKTQKLMDRPFERIDGGTSVYGFDTGEYAPVTFGSNAHNEGVALDARVLAATIEPDADVLKECIDFLKANHRIIFKDVYKVKSLTWTEYLAGSNASPELKKALDREHTQMIAEGVSEDTVFSRREAIRITKRGGFAKEENNLYHSPGGDKIKAPRLIQSASLRYTCIMGPWFAALQQLIKRRWNLDNNLVFTSGLTTTQTAEYITSKEGNIAEDDIGKFDSSVSVPWCEYECWITKMFGAPRGVNQLMRANIKTHGTTTNGWDYFVPGTRKSGDPFTSLYNSIINGLSHTFIYCKVNAVTWVEARKRIWMLVQGDDNAMVYVGKLIDWVHWMRKLGFDSVAIPRKNFEELEFCSSRLYHASKGWVWGPKPGRVLAKLGYIVRAPKGVTRESMMRGVALGLLPTAGFIPPLRAAAMRILQLTQGHQAYFRSEYVEHKMTSVEKCTTTIDVIHALDSVYAWSPTRQSMFEQELSKMQLGDPYPSSLIHILLDHDTGAPKVLWN